MPGKASGVLKIGSSLSPYPLVSTPLLPLSQPSGTPHECHWGGPTDGVAKLPPDPHFQGRFRFLPLTQVGSIWTILFQSFGALIMCTHHPCFMCFSKASWTADQTPVDWVVSASTWDLRPLGFCWGCLFLQGEATTFPTPLPTPPVAFQTLRAVPCPTATSEANQGTQRLCTAKVAPCQRGKQWTEPSVVNSAQS